jgi:hypothetical protein
VPVRPPRAPALLARLTELRRIFTTSPLVAGTRFRNQIGPAWAAWEKLSADALAKRLGSGQHRVPMASVAGWPHLLTLHIGPRSNIPRF